MITKDYLISMFTVTTVNEAEALLKKDAVHNLDISEDPDTGLTEISGDVRTGTRDYHPTVWLNEDKGWIFDEECGCPAHARSGRCVHTAVLALKYIALKEQNAYSTPESKPARPTDKNVAKLLEKLEEPVLDPEVFGAVRVLPHLETDFIDTDAVRVEFRIQRHGHKSYILQDISSFIEHIDSHENWRYGKELEFVHDLSAFDEASRPVVIFLRSLVRKEDTYRSASGIYDAYGEWLRRSLALKGRYLDAFMHAAENLPLEILTRSGDDAQCIRKDGLPELEADLSHTENGYLLTMPAVQLFKGFRYLYLFDESTNTLCKAERSSEKLVALLDYMQEAKGMPQFIADQDLTSFARDLWPLLTKNAALHNDGFDPYDYLPQKPAYEIYLDAPGRDTVTCGLFAVYGEERYNISDAQDILPAGRRDTVDERHMNNFVGKWFNAFNPAQKNFILSHDEDRLYDLISSCIPGMQKKGTVYISDAMHKIALRPAPRITVGVSLSGESLLDLDMHADTMSMAEVAEILTRYDRRRRYYRLKNGEFVDLENSASLDAFASLADTLQLKAGDIAKGSGEVPKYRAMYLDAMAEEASMEIDRDTRFRDLIAHLHDTDIDLYEPPKELDHIMRGYQKEGCRWLSALYENGFGALLADEMGLGKTLQVLAFLKGHKDKGRTLIACPASLVYNWYQEIQRFTPDLPAVMIQGPAEIRHEDARRADANAILITSYDLLKRDIDVYADMKFTFEVIDEAQYIKNAGTQAARAVKAVPADFHIALTGTPIENRLSELWSIFDYIMPGFFRSYRSFRDTYEIPIVKEKDTWAEAQLQRMIRPFVLRRRKKDVLKDLPDKLEEVYYASAEGEQRDLYNARIQYIRSHAASLSDEEFRHSKIEILSELMRLRQICCSPALLYEDYKGPSAKEDLDEVDAQVFKGPSAKEDLCIDLIRNAVEAGHKVLLFSQFTSMLAILTGRLKEEHIRCYTLQGSTPKVQRARMVEQFQTDDVPVFAISLKAGGTGLNLTAADIVIHYDPWWNTAVENQASDRAHRIGQKNVVSVYRLIMKDTIEEKILKLQSDKADLAERMMNGEGISSASLTRDDLLALLD